MKILVTGGMGQLGWDCREVFTGHEVLALDLPNLDITEAASVDGATRWQKFRFITWPSMKGIYLTSTILH